jgi:hypothetical protein
LRQRNPKLGYEQYGEPARLCRLRLHEFLKSMPESHCQMATKEALEHAESVTIVGNWFAAKSMNAQIGKGYFQTIFTRHAPTVIDALEAFDEEFDELLKTAGVSPRNSRSWAIRRLEEEMAPLPRTAAAAK